MLSSAPQPQTQPPTILWQQVWGLTVLLAAHSFGWMAYNLFQPQLLQSLGFLQLALWLGIFQGLLAAGLMFGLIFTPQIPFALQTLPTHQAGLATGTLFGGIGFATALASLVLLLATPSGLTLIGWGGLALLLTLLGIRLTGR